MSDQTRARLWLSRDALDGIRNLVQHRSNLEAIYRASSSERPATSVMALTTRVAKTTGIDAASVYEVLIALWNLRRLHMAGNLSGHDFVASVSASLSQQAGKAVEQEMRSGWDEMAPALATILPEIVPDIVDAPEDDEERRDRQRQQEIENLRAQDKEGFDRIESIMPDLDDLLSISTAPPREWLEEPLP